MTGTRIALVTDLHGNAVALEAVLSKIRAQSPDLIVSLGDQVNLGPCPRETMQMLRDAGARMLIGNHERYVISRMRKDGRLTGANFDALDFTAQKFTESELTLPEQFMVGSICFCHSIPGDDAFPIYDVDRATPILMDMTFPGITQIICGHGHNPTFYHLPHIQISSIGSSGCMDAGIPGAASYTMATVFPDHTALKPLFAAYDCRALQRSFLDSGMADAEPIMAHISCLQMTENDSYLVPFVRHAQRISKERGEAVLSRDSWQEADRTYSWPGGLTSEAYWDEMRRMLR